MVALNRMAYGPRPGEVQAVQALGLNAYVEQQLNPAALDDSICDQRLAAARVRTQEPRSMKAEGPWDDYRSR